MFSELWHERCLPRILSLTVNYIIALYITEMIVAIQISKCVALYNSVYMREILYVSNSWHTNEVLKHNKTFASWELPVHD